MYIQTVYLQLPHKSKIKKLRLQLMVNLGGCIHSNDINQKALNLHKRWIVNWHPPTYIDFEILIYILLWRINISKHHPVNCTRLKDDTK